MDARAAVIDEFFAQGQTAIEIAGSLSMDADQVLQIRTRDRVGACPVVEAGATAVFLVLFDDRDRRPEIVVGESVARERFKQIGSQYNAHLFVKLESNSSDDPYYDCNASFGAHAKRDAEIDNLIAKIRAAKSMAMRDSLFEKLVETWEAVSAPAEASSN